MSDETPQTTPNDETLRRRLLSRIAAGAVIIVGLLVGLTVFDVFNAPAPPPAPLARAPESPPPPAKVEEKPAEPAVEARKGEEAAAEPESSAAPAAPPLAEPKGVRPLTKPATARPAMQKQAELPAPARPEPGREIARGEAAPAARHAAPASPLARAVEATRQYILQVGVFSNVANAEDLRAKLSLNGMPSQIEARVQVGPFKTKAEADAARQKLVDLGMEPGIVLAVKR